MGWRERGGGGRRRRRRRQARGEGRIVLSSHGREDHAGSFV